MMKAGIALERLRADTLEMSTAPDDMEILLKYSSSGILVVNAVRLLAKRHGIDNQTAWKTLIRDY
jgi:hypothetical protein